MAKQRNHRGNPFKRYKTKEDEIANNKNYTWTFIYYVTNPLTHKKKQKYKGGFKTWTEANNQLKNMLVKISKGDYINTKNITIEEYLNNWLQLIKVNIKPTTLDYYTNAVKNHILPCLGKKKLQELSVEDVEKFFTIKRNQEVYANGYPGKLKENSLKAIYCTLRKSFNDAVDKEYLLKNPVLRAKNRPKKITEYTGKIYNKKEIEQLLTAVDGTQFEIPVTMASILGIRRGEVFAFKWKDVDFENNILHIGHNLVRANNQFTYTTPKTKYSIRDLEMPKILYEQLKSRKDNLIANSMYNESNFIFSNSNDTLPDPLLFGKNFSNFLRKMKMEHITFHSLRHSAATIMLHDLEIPVKVVSQILGHSDVVVTLNMYCTVFKNTEKESMKKINDAWD